MRGLPLSSMLLGIALLAIAAMAHGSEIAVFQLQSQPPQAVAPKLREVLGGAVTISHFGNKIIVRGDPAQLDNARYLITQFDLPPRRLLIEVRQQRHQRSDVGQLSADARRSSDGQGNAARMQGFQAGTRRDRDGIQRVQAINGHAAFISVGQSIPIHNLRHERDGRRVTIDHNVDYRDATRGFYAVPQVVGERVTVWIHQHDERLSNRTGVFDTSQAATMVNGRLGEWLSFGSTTGNTIDENRDFGRRASTYRRNDTALEIRVTALN